MLSPCLQFNWQLLVFFSIDHHLPALFEIMVQGRISRLIMLLNKLNNDFTLRAEINHTKLINMKFLLLISTKSPTNYWISCNFFYYKKNANLLYNFLFILCDSFIHNDDNLWVFKSNFKWEKLSVLRNKSEKWRMKGRKNRWKENQESLFNFIYSIQKYPYALLRDWLKIERRKTFLVR